MKTWAESAKGYANGLKPQLFDDKFGHDVAHLQGEQTFLPKSLIYDINRHLYDAKSRIQGSDSQVPVVQLI